MKLKYLSLFLITTIICAPNEITLKDGRALQIGHVYKTPNPVISFIRTTSDGEKTFIQCNKGKDESEIIQSLSVNDKDYIILAEADKLKLLYNPTLSIFYTLYNDALTELPYTFLKLYSSEAICYITIMDKECKLRVLKLMLAIALNLMAMK